MTPLAIRADAGPAIGAGHAMRSLALAEAWHRARAGDVTWFTAAPPAFVRTAATERGVATHECSSSAAAMNALVEWARANSAAWVVFDGYDFDVTAQRAVCDTGAHLLAVDDCAAGAEFVCDILLNQNIDAEFIEYRTAPRTRRLMGPRYALLRSEFISEPAVWRFDEPATRIVVTFGGADVHDQAGRVARLLASLTPPVDAVVVTGQAHPHAASDAVVAEGIRVQWRSASREMARLLRSADLIVCAAGSTCWEVAHLGIPALTLTVSDNQQRIAAGLHAAGVVRSLGWFDRVDDDTLAGAIESLRRDPERAEMSRRGRALVDGRGADRVAQAMIQRATRVHTVTLRRATMDDAARLFSWRVDEETVRNSSGPPPESYDAHCTWLEQTLQNPRVALYVGCESNHQRPVGTVRLDRLSDDEFELSITVDPALRGRGYGRQLIEQAAKAAGPLRLIAHVKESNPASLRTFAALGFRGAERDGDMLRLVRE